MKVMLNNLLTNICTHLKKNRSTSQPLTDKKRKDKKTNLISRMYQRMGKMRSISRDKETTEVKKQIIDDRVGDEPM